MAFRLVPVLVASLLVVSNVQFGNGQCFKSDGSVSSETNVNADYQAAFNERQLDFSLDMFHKFYNKVKHESLCKALAMLV